MDCARTRPRRHARRGRGAALPYRVHVGKSIVEVSKAALEHLLDPHGRVALAGALARHGRTPANSVRLRLPPPTRSALLRCVSSIFCLRRCCKRGRPCHRCHPVRKRHCRGHRSLYSSLCALGCPRCIRSCLHLGLDRLDCLLQLCLLRHQLRLATILSASLRIAIAVALTPIGIFITTATILRIAIAVALTPIGIFITTATILSASLLIAIAVALTPIGIFITTAILSASLRIAIAIALTPIGIADAILSLFVTTASSIAPLTAGIFISFATALLPFITLVRGCLLSLSLSILSLSLSITTTTLFASVTVNVASIISISLTALLDEKQRQRFVSSSQRLV